MRVTEFDGFWQVTAMPTLFPVSVYLVADHDGLILVDTGLPPFAPGILRAAGRLGRPIRRIALTHAHFDHAGAVDRLIAALPEAELICSAREAPILAGDPSANGPSAPPDARPSPPPRLPGRFRPVAASPHRLVHDADRLGPLTVLASPGHTPGHVCYFMEATGALFAGDAFFTRGGLAVAGQKQALFPFVSRATWDQELAAASAARLAALPIRHLATAHGPVLRDPCDRLREAVVRASSAARRTAPR
ncbi:MAG: MBL fold metallo-hydrolase [Bifidobacteriaceae bacterium]|nr:MBL fold metallo-hydrolase [Bifidobacteriaceae bacterium]